MWQLRGISCLTLPAEPGGGLLGAARWQLPFPPSYTAGIIQAAKSLLERIYKLGFVYHKAGVFLSGIMADTERQQGILASINNEQQLRVMRAVDEINRRYGRYTVRPLAARGGK